VFQTAKIKKNTGHFRGYLCYSSFFFIFRRSARGGQ